MLCPIVQYYRDPRTRPNIFVRSCPHSTHSMLTEPSHRPHHRLPARSLEGDVDVNFFEKMWSLLVPRGTDIYAETARFRRDPGAYLAPLSPWLERLAGGAYIFRTRQAASATASNTVGGGSGSGAIHGCYQPEPDLLRDLVALHDVNTLLMAAERMPEGQQRALLRAFAAQDPEGPWGDLVAELAAPGLDKRARDEMLEALPACLQYVGVFAPMPGFPAGGVSNDLPLQRLHAACRMLWSAVPYGKRWCRALPLYAHSALPLYAHSASNALKSVGLGAHACATVDVLVAALAAHR